MANSALVQEISKELRSLSETQQARVLTFIRQELKSPPFDLGEWLKQATAIHDELVAQYGEHHFFGVQETLDEIREEASWPRQ